MFASVGLGLAVSLLLDGLTQYCCADANPLDMLTTLMPVMEPDRATADYSYSVDNENSNPTTAASTTTRKFYQLVAKSIIRKFSSVPMWVNLHLVLY